MSYDIITKPYFWNPEIIYGTSVALIFEQSSVTSKAFYTI